MTSRFVDLPSELLSAVADLLSKREEVSALAAVDPKVSRRLADEQQSAGRIFRQSISLRTEWLKRHDFTLRSGQFDYVAALAAAYRLLTPPNVLGLPVTEVEMYYVREPVAIAVEQGFEQYVKNYLALPLEQQDYKMHDGGYYAERFRGELLASAVLNRDVEMVRLLIERNQTVVLGIEVELVVMTPEIHQALLDQSESAKLIDRLGPSRVALLLQLNDLRDGLDVAAVELNIRDFNYGWATDSVRVVEACIPVEDRKQLDGQILYRLIKYRANKLIKYYGSNINAADIAETLVSPRKPFANIYFSEQNILDFLPVIVGPDAGDNVLANMDKWSVILANGSGTTQEFMTNQVTAVHALMKYLPESASDSGIGRRDASLLSRPDGRAVRTTAAALIPVIENFSKFGGNKSDIFSYTYRLMAAVDYHNLDNADYRHYVSYVLANISISKKPTLQSVYLRFVQHYMMLGHMPPRPFKILAIEPTKGRPEPNIKAMTDAQTKALSVEGEDSFEISAAMRPGPCVLIGADFGRAHNMHKILRGYHTFQGRRTELTPEQLYVLPAARGTDDTVTIVFVREPVNLFNTASRNPTFWLSQNGIQDEEWLHRMFPST